MDMEAATGWWACKESACLKGDEGSIPVLSPWVQALSLEDPLEKEMATHFSILAWEIPWAEKPGGLQSMGLQRVGHA